MTEFLNFAIDTLAIDLIDGRRRSEEWESVTMTEAVIMSGAIAVTTKTRSFHRKYPPAVMPLENGDHLSRIEFERRYEAMPEEKHAELIEGVVYMASPIRHDHGWAQGEMIGWLGQYCASTLGVKMLGNVTLRLDARNEFEPDALLRIESGTTGRSRLCADGYIEGAPELIIEIALSSVSRDVHSKKRVYQRNGVQEYLVWRVSDNCIDWFHLIEGVYQPLLPDAEGVIRSQIFPGLSLSVPAMLAGDLAAVFAVLQQGIRTEEHAAFVQILNNTYSSPT